MSIHKLSRASTRTATNSRMWHPDIPELQISWDATSLKNLMFCPRKYFFEIVLGFKTDKESVHLIFGRYYHSALECYDAALAAGGTWEEAREAAVMRALNISYNWESQDKTKNRFNLWRTVQWYCEQYPKHSDHVKPVVDKDGVPLIELPFSFTLPVDYPGGHNYLICGYFDGIVEAMGSFFARERKTTGHTINTDWFSTFDIDAQIDLYSLASKICFDIKVRGVLIDGAQISINFSRFARAPSFRTEPQLEEFVKDLEYWIKQAEKFALEEYWPKASRFCFMCPFRVVCGRDPASQTGALLGNFRIEDWDPTIERSAV